MSRILSKSRLMRLLNGEQLAKIAEDGTIFRAAANGEIARRSRKADKREMKGGSRK